VPVTLRRKELLPGTLDMLILRIVSLEPVHGWAISHRIEQVSGNVLQINQGSLYPSLHRLEREGWIASKWGSTGDGRRAKFYALTRRGRARLAAETETWESLSGAVNRVLKLA
jgi:transcriptional regulator